MIKRVGKRGDTLVEVMLAVGIFSMVAVAVVAVMSSGTSSSQVALETTLTREEIDTQAEALRFIHSAYITAREADPEGGESSPYAKLWHAITGDADTQPLAIDFNQGSWDDDQKKSILQYSPSDCGALYSNDDAQARAHGFIINTRALSGFDSLDPSNETAINNAVSEIIVTGQATETIEEGAEITTAHFLTPTTTYPRLVFRNNLSNTDNTNLLSGNSFDALYRAEGIYIVAVKDPSSTTLYNKDEKQLETGTAAYYDFYIRSCWYGTGDQTPSSISTVMRLYDPEVIKYDPTVIDPPEDDPQCVDDETPDHILVDTNMYINRDTTLDKSGVDGISIEYEIDSVSGETINTSDHMKCAYYLSEGVANPYVTPYGLAYPFEYPHGSNQYCPNGSTRLKVVEGNLGDFWYPVHIGDTITVTLRSTDYELFYEDNRTSNTGDDEKYNSYICAKTGVTCTFCPSDSEDPSSCIDMYKIEEDGTRLIRSKIEGMHQLTVSFTVGSCVANDTANDGTIPSISINTSWEIPRRNNTP